MYADPGMADRTRMTSPDDHEGEEGGVTSEEGGVRGEKCW